MAGSACSRAFGRVCGANAREEEGAGVLGRIGLNTACMLTSKEECNNAIFLFEDFEVAGGMVVNELTSDVPVEISTWGFANLQAKMERRRFGQST